MVSTDGRSRTPTMADAYIDLLRSPELLIHLLRGAPLLTLLQEIQCGDAGVQGAIDVPPILFDEVVRRLADPSSALEAETFWVREPFSRGDVTAAFSAP